MPKIGYANYVQSSGRDQALPFRIGTPVRLKRILQTRAIVVAVVVFIWKEQQKLTASDAAFNDNFGNSVSIYGNTAIVGARQNDDAGVNSGSAYIFTYDGSTWTETAKLTAFDAAAGDQFGYSVSIYDNTAIVGAPFDYGARGSAYIFTTTDNWASTTQNKLTSLAPVANDRFGFSVSIYDNTAIIGVPYDDNRLGTAYVFTRSGTNWVLKSIIIPNFRIGNSQFGYSVSIYKNTAIIGANLFNSARGAAYVYTTTNNWASRTEKARITASDAAAGDQFGYSVNIYDNTAIVGTPFDDDAGSASGAAYVYTTTDNWASRTEKKLTASDASGNDNFGKSVSIYDNTAIVGAIYDDNRPGAAYVFTRSGTNWTQQQKLTASDAAANDEFGTSVGIYGDSAIIGARFDDDAGSNSGSAYVFNYTSQ